MRTALLVLKEAAMLVWLLGVLYGVLVLGHAVGLS